MRIKLNEEAKKAIEDAVQQLRNFGFIVKNPEFSLYAADVAVTGEELKEELQAVLKITFELYVPDKYLQMEI